MQPRTSLGAKLRFAVLERDKFTCRYCGRKAPDVVLHVEHITSVHSGGTNSLNNLIASCSDCNLGKGKQSLDNATSIELAAPASWTMTLRDAVKISGLSAPFLSRAIKAGKLPAIKVGRAGQRKYYKIRREQLEKFILDCEAACVLEGTQQVAV